MCNLVECFGTLPKFFTIMSRRKVGSTRSGRGTGTSQGSQPSTTSGGSIRTSTTADTGVVNRPTGPIDISGLGFTDLPKGGLTGGQTFADWFQGLTGLNSQSGVNFGSLLGALGDSTTNPLFYFLAMMHFMNSKDLTQEQANDWNKQLLDQIIALMVENDKRAYNESMRDEQRLYDNPQNQLALLMGAGISRDAAIQLLGQGSEPIQSEGADVVEGLSPSQSLANEVDAQSKTLSAAFQSVGVIASAIGGLGAFGISAASLATMLSATKASTANTLLSNESLKKTLNGIDVASSVIGALSSYENSGKTLPDFSSVQDMTKFIRDNVSGFEPFKALQDSGALSKIPQDVYALTALNDGYMNWRKSKDFNIDRTHIVRMQGITQLRGAIDIELVESEIEQNYANIDTMIGQLFNDNLKTDALVAKTGAEIGLINEQTINQQYENQILKTDADFFGANSSAINGMRLRQLMFDASCWEQFANDPVAYQNAIKGWLSDKDNAATAATLESIYLADELGFQKNLHSDDPVKSAGKGLRNVALWFHNLTRESLGAPSETAQNVRQYGSFAKSAVMMYLFKKP